MPPKGKRDSESENPPPLLGRVGTNLKMGIVGLPNVGKSTFFNVLTKSAVPAENFPFCTIDPNEARVAVPDARFDFLCEHHQPDKRTPAWLTIMDIAGLVRGASEGQGLGNAFLSHIKAVDGIFHVLRAFESEDITHVEGEVDPIRDLQIIADELRLKDIEYVQKELDRLGKTVLRGGGDKQMKADFEFFTRISKLLTEEKKHVRFAASTFKENDIDVLNQHLLITAKPLVYLVNLSEAHYLAKGRGNPWLAKIKKFLDEHDPGALIIPFSAEFEAKWLEMDAAARAAITAEKGVSTALEKIIVNGYHALGLQHFFTSGKDEVRAWTVQRGTRAPQAAGKIHTDMEKGFIQAEVMAFEDFKQEGSESKVREAGKYKQKGRDYIVEDGDILFIKFNVSAGGKDAKKK